MQVQSLCWEDALGEGMATHSSILAWRIHRQRSLVGYSPKSHKESDTTEDLAHMRVCKESSHVCCTQLHHYKYLTLMY